MNILSRYIARNLIQGWLMVLAVLGAVFGLVGLIEELDRTQADYGVAEVVQYTLMILPTQLLDLAPVGVLLGTIVALAGLDRHNELTVVSCSGVPVGGLLKAIAAPTVLLMAGLWLMLEYVSAPLYLEAQQMKSNARDEHPDILPDGGVWSKQGNRFIRLGAMHGGRQPGDINLYRFDEAGQLVLALDARTAEVSVDRRWRFQKVLQKQWQDQQLISSRLPEIVIDNLWSPGELPTLTLSAESMPLSILHDYAQYLKASGQASVGYEMTFWRRLCLPVTAAAMVLLATPISANISSRRNRNFGINMSIGVFIGIFFFLGTQIIYALGQMLDISPITTALAPAVLVATVSAGMIRQMRW